MGRRLDIIDQIAKLAIALPEDPAEQQEDEESRTYSELRQAALILLGDLVCGQPENGAKILRLSHEIGPDAAVMVFRPLAETADKVEMNVVSGAVRLALAADLYEERVSAEYLFACLLHENANLQVAHRGPRHHAAAG